MTIVLVRGAVFSVSCGHIFLGPEDAVRDRRIGGHDAACRQAVAPSGHSISLTLAVHCTGYGHPAPPVGSPRHLATRLHGFIRTVVIV